MHRARRSRIRSTRVSLIRGRSCPAIVQFVVLGAKGSIGGAVVRRARFSGHQVRAVVRPSAGTDRFPAGTEVVHADLQSRDSVVEAARGADVVVHAANVPYPEWPRLVPALAENALAAAEAAGAILAFPGNVYVYGHPRSRPVLETHPQEPNTQKGKLRLRVEQMFLQAHGDGRVRLVLPRYPDFYGPGIMHEILRPIFEGAVRGRSCRWPLDADAPHEFILIDDAAEAMLKLVAMPAAHGRAVHVPGPRPITPREFIRLVYASVDGREPTIRVFGRGTFRFVGLFNRLARSAYEMAYLFDDPVLLDGSLYRSLTGNPYPATPYEDGVRRTMDWFRSHRTTS
jgi:nucleoside-diphosphate-sugar epimerase